MPSEMKTKLKSFFLKEDIKSISRFIGYFTLFGIPLNFSLFVIFKIPFTLYSWIGWGIGFWFIEKRIIPMLRSIFVK